MKLPCESPLADPSGTYPSLRAFGIYHRGEAQSLAEMVFLSELR